MSAQYRFRRNTSGFKVMTLAVVGLSGASACSSGYEEAPVGEFANPPGTGAKGSGSSGGFTSGEGGAGGESSASGGRMGFGGAVTGPDLGEADDPICPTDAEWGKPKLLLGISTDVGDERLLAISPDERTIVFLRDDAVYVADRSSSSGNFAAVSPLAVPNGYDVELGLALTPDALTIVLTRENSAGFGEISRVSRSEAFSLVADEAPYFVINALYPMAGIELSHPVISAAGSEFWWVETRVETSVWFTRFDVGDLARGTQVGCNELGCTLMLDGYAGSRKLLTGLSEDLLTVFLVDDLSGPEARTRTHAIVDAGFFEGQSLEPRLDARPNGSCTRLYYSSSGDILFDTR